jgi:hypothetical protein
MEGRYQVMVKTYSLNSDGEKQLTKDYKVKDFKCKDGTDTILLDQLLADMIQAANDFYDVKIIINSAYRTESHNRKVGGDPHSNHLVGRALDITVYNKARVSLEELAMFFETRGLTSIILYSYDSGWIHIGSTLAGSLKRQTSAVNSTKVSTFTPALRRQIWPRYSYPCEVMQKLLQKKGFYLKDNKGRPYKLDGKFGPGSDVQLRAFQKSRKLKVDGTCGDTTWKALFA